MEDILKALYQAAQCLIISTKLYQQDPAACLKAKQTGQYLPLSAVNHALLIYEYDIAASLMDEHTSPYIQLFYKMLHTKYEKADTLLSACEQAADPIYRGADFQLVSALCGRDPEQIRVCAVKMLRAIRAMESIYCEVFPIFLILALRCTAQMGIPIRKINVSELPEALIGRDSPFDKENSMPFGAEKLQF